MAKIPVSTALTLTAMLRRWPLQTASGADVAPYFHSFARAVRAIYAPEVNKDQVRIAAELTNVRFEDPRNDDRFAVLSGRFDFLYVRGSPAQRFP